ncbi:MAG: histidinol-phosphatase [Desulfovibrio sp.]|jgi:histidinol-phosphatase (PHP family)|nr:histidinol-phosphatase [Desulfovibrio sp.]
MRPSSNFPKDFRPSPIRADLHMHTSHSHGEASTRDMYLAARSKGLTIIGFSEHSPRPETHSYPTDYQEKLREGIPAYVREVSALARSAEESGVEVLLGIEADYIPMREDFTVSFLRNYPFAYVIGGLHFQGEWGFDRSADDWMPLSGTERAKIYVRYYEDMIRMCKSRLFDIVAHPDLVKIFSIADFRDWIAEESSFSLVRDALIAMRDNGLLMEVSSAGLRKPCKEIYPGPRIMSLAAELGLSISFASDAHCINTPAYAFPELAAYAASFGYRESAVPRNRELRFFPFSSPGKP